MASTIVIKIGGSAVGNAAALASDIAKVAKDTGERFVIVHGGASLVTQYAEKLGKPQRFVESKSGFKSRFTDKETMRIFSMVTCGLVNKALVEAFLQNGVNALGIAGADGGIVRARRKDALVIVEDGREKILRGDYSGKIEAVNGGKLQGLLGLGYCPVIAPVALSLENEMVSLDADRCAAAVAAAIGAEKLIILTDVDGFCRNYPDDLLNEIPSKAGLDEAMGIAKGGMKKKLLAASEALAGGVGKVIIANGLSKTPLSSALAGNLRTVIALTAKLEGNPND